MKIGWHQPSHSQIDEGVQSPKRNAQYLGSITILSFDDWIPREHLKNIFCSSFLEKTALNLCFLNPMTHPRQLPF